MPAARGWMTAILLAVGCAPAGVTEPAAHTRVVTMRAPDGARLPHAIIDAAGTIHLVYMTGDPRAGDLRYATRAADAPAWSAPVRVNSEPGTVTGIGPIDGGQLALGRNGRLHVVWFTIDTGEFYYTRTGDDGVFEPQFSLAGGDGVEAGPTVAADPTGNVFVFWHAGDVEDAQRAVYLAASRDDGATFEPIRAASTPAEGACACCSLHALTDETGGLSLSYRGAGENIRRGQRLATSTDGGASFADVLIHAWELGACPVSTTALTRGPSGLVVAWETEGQVYLAPVDRLDDAQAPPGQATLRRKNPAVAVDARGETLLVWADGRGFRSGGSLHWQIFDADGRATEIRDSGTDTVPDGSVPAALARGDGTFLVIY